MDKFTDSFLLDEFQVILDTHHVIFPVSTVHTMDLFTRILVAFKTKDRFPFGNIINSRTLAK